MGETLRYAAAGSFPPSDGLVNVLPPSPGRLMRCLRSRPITWWLQTSTPRPAGNPVGDRPRRQGRALQSFESRHLADRSRRMRRPGFAP